MTMEERAAKAAEVEASFADLEAKLGEWRTLATQHGTEATGHRRAMLQQDSHLARMIVVRLRQILEDKRCLSQLVNSPCESLDVVDARQVDAALS